MARLPHAAPQYLLRNQDIKQWRSWGAHQSLHGKFGLKGPPTALLDFHSNSIAGLPLQQHCWASTQAFFLPPLLYSGSDPHQPSSSVLVFSVSLLVRALIPPRGWHLHDPIFSQGPLTLEIRASTFQCWRVTFSSYQLPTKKISVILISYQN